ncbi:MAG: sigma 54-interacting transcriptional regulator [Candidatus Acidiferrales bacterium]
MASNNIDIAPVRGESGFVGGMSAAMQTLENVVAEIALTNIPVLLVGESGTGKEMFAQRIHCLSAHSDAPLAKISCASLNIANFANELGLDSNGNSANGKLSTVFFDEISELDSTCQRNLLYALPDGDARPRRGLLGARVISTTSRNLDEEMRMGRFRSELYYRITGACLRLPPLRDRKEDIPLLVESFLTRCAVELNRARPTLSPRTLRRFLDYSWPGNIRQLSNVVKKIVALGDENLALPEVATAPVEMRPEPTETRSYSLKAAARAASREAERGMILEALARTRWNRKRAAQELQISYKSLLYKLKQIGLPESQTE